MAPALTGAPIPPQLTSAALSAIEAALSGFPAAASPESAAEPGRHDAAPSTQRSAYHPPPWPRAARMLLLQLRWISPRR